MPAEIILTKQAEGSPLSTVYVRSTRQAVENFKIKLEKYGINVTIRREMGSDIDGACGQLRKSYMEKTESEK